MFAKVLSFLLLLETTKIKDYQTFILLSSANVDILLKNLSYLPWLCSVFVLSLNFRILISTFEPGQLLSLVNQFRKC